MEILAPVGSFEVLVSAINAGSDAVYLAGKNFGARASANNFDNDELIDAIKYAHRLGVKVYITVNTLIFEEEMGEVLDFIKFIYLAGADAVILQDLGLASVIHKNFPDFKMHASTQINAQTLDDVKVLKDLGFSRVILGREVSIDEIKKIKESGIDIELEAFIHGALCISYSGNCLFSSFEGGRSGNRGRCAQPCRKSYKLFKKRGFYLSPKDLSTIDEIKTLSKYLDSMKIEGRMKSPSYVYQVVRSYKLALTTNVNIEELKYNMKVAFNRGFTKGFILNEENKNLTNTNSSNHQGVEVGSVIDSSPNKTLIELTQDLHDGDSIRIVGKGQEDSVIINGMYVNGLLTKVAKSNDKVLIRSHLIMNKGDIVLLTKREDITTINKTIDLTLTIKNDDKNLTICFSDGINSVLKKLSYEEAKTNQNEKLIEKLTKTGGTIYNVKRIDNFLSKEIYVNVKDVNESRRSLLDELTIKRENRYNRKDVSNITYPYLDNIPKADENFKYLIAVSNKEQLEEVVDYLKYNKQEALIATRFKSDYLYYLPRVGVSNRNIAAVSSNLASSGLISSVYFNVTNSATVRVLEHLGYKIIGLSLELSKKDLKKLVSGYKERYKALPNLMVMIYGRIELMHMKHCFLNKALHKDALHCGKCQEDVYFDNKYPLYGDSLCHLSILSKDPLYLLSKISDLEEMGITKYFINFYKEDVIDVRSILEEINEPLEGGYFGHYYKEVL